MKLGQWLIFWGVGIIAVGLWAGSAYFSRNARLHRRRRKSHSRIISKAKEPAIKLSVHPPKDKED